MITVFETIMLSKLYDLSLYIFTNETVGSQRKGGGPAVFNVIPQRAQRTT